MSELLRTGRMNAHGTLRRRRDRASRSMPRHDIYFLESDVNELAQAKGANVAGLHVVFSSYGISFDDVDVFYLAGGFGRHLKKDASRRIGLIPNLPDGKIVQVGNAAIEGACIALLSAAQREALEALVRRVEHCRLETHPGLLRLLRRRVSVQARGVGDSGAAMIEIIDPCPDVDVQPAEYKRLLGYPRDSVVSDRAQRAGGLGARLVRERTDSRGCMHAQADALGDLTGDARDDRRRVVLQPAAFADAAGTPTRRQRRRRRRRAPDPSSRLEAQQLWHDGKPDEYFFLEVYGSAVVEHLVTMTGARLCAWAESQAHGRAAALQSRLSRSGRLTSSRGCWI